MPSPAPTYRTFTTKWHKDPYPSISVLKPSLSCSGKTVVITGGGSGIGASIASSFALAGASSIGLIGRNSSTLQSTSSSISKLSPKTTVSYQVYDITSKSSLEAAFAAFGEKFGKIDVCVSNAGYLSKLEPIDGADDEDWWKGFETNVKGGFNMIQAFLPYAASNAVLININAGLATIPAIPKLSSYICSKVASAKMYECLQAEQPELRVINVHPGVVETGMSEKVGVKGEDSPDLVGGFCVWCASEEGAFLKGKFVWANWDADELMARKEEIQGSKLLELTTLLGAYAF